MVVAVLFISWSRWFLRDFQPFLLINSLEILCLDSLPQPIPFFSSAERLLTSSQQSVPCQLSVVMICFVYYCPLPPFHLMSSSQYMMVIPKDEIASLESSWFEKSICILQRRSFKEAAASTAAAWRCQRNLLDLAQLGTSFRCRLETDGAVHYFISNSVSRATLKA